MTEVTVATDIAASADKVWEVLTQLGEYRAWNPFIRDATGSLEVGDRVHVNVHTALPVALEFDAKIVGRQEGRVLRWRGSFGRTWIGTGDHEFLIEPLDEHHARFTQRERFTGLLPWLTGRVLAREVKRGFEAMNAALAAQAERAEGHAA